MPAVVDPGMMFRVGAVISIVGGTMFLMWLGEQITSRGIGNGVSLIIMAGIVAQLPRTLCQMFTQAATGSMGRARSSRSSSARGPHRCSSASWSARSAAS
jgi:preprotein translocase subunit SecY